MFSESFALAVAAYVVVKAVEAVVGRSGADGSGGVVAPVAFVRFQRNYLAVYLLAMGADWLKGPYAYVLYESYGFSNGDIALLFMGGFGASMVFGTVAGSVADTLGRKRAVLAFALAYSLASLTKLSSSFGVLLGGRVASGIATSLLFSVFEAWMVCEHNARGFDPSLLADTFSKTTLGNGMVAVTAGLLASGLAERFGFVAPFLAAVVPLVALGAIVAVTWPENYGDASVNVGQGMANGLSTLLTTPKVLCLGLAQALFEGGMYVFVFMWSPALATAETRDTLPYGFIFAVFMVCVMVGSAIFGLVAGFSLKAVPIVLHVAAASAMATVAYCNASKAVVYGAFLTFEVACGMFFPSYGTLRSMHVPEAARSAVMNFTRVPLNAFVIALLYAVKFVDLEVTSVFWICACAQACAGVFYLVFVALDLAPDAGAAAAAKKSQ
ncbi:major facilitator superfamily transporter [Thecamonas trahens ATCC 50062]|uniref:Molybdate-anion transporter n=1 Tax=Thecamonas trahens ATCC 50062 TaxID=461836 RepID=A0A0L0D1K6_THETB|nr:major facilitator superfamily transporter [Thecamonas trahens ATCC 50062]KNC46020.1 major facilitator superfamily transporter [Thecamonas trahens ATCC 50062]|eukprot:XP_013763000.1 major facilitator superfamily transporter [Thecamonas trahens ATCC 50062]